MNRGFPQGTVLGPILISIMVDDIKTADPKNELVKFADDLTLEVPVNVTGDASQMEFDNVQAWSRENRMPLNLEKSACNDRSWDYDCDSAGSYPLC